MMTIAELTRLKTISGWADDDHDSVCDECGEPYIAEHMGDNSKLCHPCAQIVVHDDVPKLLDEIERLQAAFCGIDPADLPKFVEAVRSYDRMDSTGKGGNVHGELLAAAACLPENRI